MTRLTRRSLLRVAALSPLIIPGRAVSRVGGAAAPAGPGPCGSPTLINTQLASEITGPGCYALNLDITGGNGLVLQNYSNVTVLGNGHTINGSVYLGRGDFSLSGIVLQDVTLTDQSQIRMFGNTSVTQTAPVVTLKNATINDTVNSASLPNAVVTTGNNILIDGLTINTYPNPSYPPSVGSDDPLEVSGISTGPTTPGTPSRWVAVKNSSFGPSYDVGLEGSSGGWDHCTFSNCHATQGTFGGIGAWYAYGSAGSGDPNCGFTITNCVFTGNTVTSWKFCSPQNPSDAAIGSNIDTATSDADANAKWGTGTAFGNVFGGAGPLANTYVALTRQQCEARAALFAKYRRNPPPAWPKSTWNQKIICP